MRFVSAGLSTSPRLVCRSNWFCERIIKGCREKFTLLALFQDQTMNLTHSKLCRILSLFPSSFFLELRGVYFIFFERGYSLKTIWKRIFKQRGRVDIAISKNSNQINWIDLGGFKSVGFSHSWIPYISLVLNRGFFFPSLPPAIGSWT